MVAFWLHGCNIAYKNLTTPMCFRSIGIYRMMVEHVAHVACFKCSNWFVVIKFFRAYEILQASEDRIQMMNLTYL